MILLVVDGDLAPSVLWQEDLLSHPHSHGNGLALLGAGAGATGHYGRLQDLYLGC